MPVQPHNPSTGNFTVPLPPSVNSLDFHCSLTTGQAILIPPKDDLCGLLHKNHTEASSNSPISQSDLSFTACHILPTSEENTDLCGTYSIASPSGNGMKTNDVINVTRSLCKSLTDSVDVKCIVRCPLAPSASGNATNWVCFGNGTGNGTEERSHVTTLAIYSTLRLISTTVMWMAVPLLDAVGVTMSRQYGAELGRQKMFSQIGFSTMPLLCGALIAVVRELSIVGFIASSGLHWQRYSLSNDYQLTNYISFIYKGMLFEGDSFFSSQYAPTYQFFH